MRQPAKQPTHYVTLRSKTNGDIGERQRDVCDFWSYPQSLSHMVRTYQHAKNHMNTKVCCIRLRDHLVQLLVSYTGPSDHLQVHQITTQDHKILASYYILELRTVFMVPSLLLNSQQPYKVGEAERQSDWSSITQVAL